jgi:hypothetical protein
MHPFVSPEFSEERRDRLRKEADTARLAAVAASRRRAERARVRVRVLDPADADSIAGLFERLSWRSRYLRFMSQGNPPR